MSIVILIAPFAETAARAWTFLQKAGVSDAAPSRREQLSPQQVQQLMLKTLRQRRNTAHAHAHSNQQGPGTALEKIWTELASDLMLGNVDHAQYGWWQTLDEHTPSFWQRFDPETRFVVVYEEPTAFAAQVIAHDTARAQDLQSILQNWHEQHSQLLNLFYALGADSLLVHASQMHCIAAFLGLNAKVEDAQANTQEILGARVLTQLLEPMTAASVQVQTLWQELQAAAQGPLEFSLPPLQMAQEVLDQYIQQQVEALAKAHALSQCDASAHEKVQLRQQLIDAQDEGELLLVQLHEVQEELEEYFVKYLDQRQQIKTVVDFWQQNPPSEVWVDMRRAQDSQGWYEAETDGRWSGPSTESALAFPPLGAGQYLVELQIADAMAPELVAGLQLSAQLDDGQVLPVDLVHEFGPADQLYPMVSTGLLQLPATQEGWHLRMTLPSVISPAEHGGTDVRQLGLRLQGVRLSLQQVDQSENQAETPA